MSSAARRLIVASNRLPVKLAGREGDWHAKVSAGGLVTALAPVLERRGGVWVGWPGTTSGDAETLRAALDAERGSRSYELAPVPLSAAEVRDFYYGFSNQVIWPLFHNCSNLCNFAPRFWAAYEAVNRRFAEAIAKLVEPGDLLWVHDYQLMHVAAELRKLGAENAIGFFNHIPFPTPDVFRCLPWHRQIARALCDFDLVGFQVPKDERHFFACLARLKADDGATRRSPEPRGASFPISIDFDEFAEQAASDGVRGRIDGLRAEYSNRQILLGVDRLDYSKGLLEKLAALRFALERFPALRGRIVLVQYVVPSRERVSEYRNLRLRIERRIGQINGAFSEPGWIPVHYYFQTLDREELCALYRLSDICLVTPIKDGMNLVAKEYCAAQVDETGVLILSEFAGAARELGRHALLVNPFDVVETSDAIHRAFSMSKVERAARMRRLREHVRTFDVHRWVDDYLAALVEPRAEATASFTWS